MCGYQRRARAALPSTPVVLARVLALAFAWATAWGADPRPTPAPDAPSIIRDGFESPRTGWGREQTDATIALQVHDRTDRATHGGKAAEHFRFSAGIGSGFYISYPLPKVPVNDALKAGLFVRANRAGVQLFARVVVPSDTDPLTNQPSFLLVPGTIYDSVDRWQRLEVIDLRPSLERQARVLRASTRRAVSLDGAYVEQLVVNLFAGSGETEVYLDDLSVGPVAAALVAAHAAANARVDAPEAEGAGPANPEVEVAAAARVNFPRNRLKKRAEDGLYHDWFFTGIHAPGADVAALRNAGFDVLIDDIGADPARLRSAVDKGFLLMPRLNREAGDGSPPDPDRVIQAAAAFPFRDAVVAWDLGDHLGRHAEAADRKAERDAVKLIVSKMRTLPPGVSRITTGVVDDDLRLFAQGARKLGMFGIKAPAWGTSVNPMDTLAFLRQRRNLTVLGNAGGLFWALLPATPPASVSVNVWGHDVPPPWGTPSVQPEQLRWMTYAALSAGYRGVAFRGDADLTRPPGRPLLLEMALLNAEIDLSESILANGADPIPSYSAYDPDPPTFTPGMAVNARVPKRKELPPVMAVRCSAIGTRDKKSVLLLAADYAGAAQFQPMQSARNDLTLTVTAPEGAEAFEISPGRFRVLGHKRDVGGTRITLPEFDTSALVLVTTDVAMAERVEAVINSIRPRAVQMAIEQAELKLRWVAEINGRLAADGHFLIDAKERKRRLDNGGSIATDEADLLRKSEEAIKAARDYAERLDWDNAWSEARRASRPLRILMRGQWANAANATERANTPAVDLANEDQIKLKRVLKVGPPLAMPATASPPLVAFNMLPQQYIWVDWMKTGGFGRNLVPSGSFDAPESLEESGWAQTDYHYDGVKSSVEFSPEGDNKPGKMIKITVMPEKKWGIDELVPFLDFPAAAIRSPAVAVRAGQFFRISVMVKRTRPTVEGVGGVVVRDSIGGDALQFVSNEAMPAMTRVVLYRRAPADGELTVTLGLAGYDTVFFDDLRVERVEAAAPAGAPGVARLPRPRRPAAAPGPPALNDRPVR